MLAALLITRQVMGNVKETIIPYAKQHLKVAKINYDLFGGAGTSPTEEKPGMISNVISRFEGIKLIHISMFWIMLCNFMRGKYLILKAKYLEK